MGLDPAQTLPRPQRERERAYRPAQALPQAQRQREYHWQSPLLNRCPPPVPKPDLGSLANGASLDGTQSQPKPSPPPIASGLITHAAQVVASMRPGFRACFQQLLDRQGVPGKVRLSIHVNCAGEISSIRAIASGLDEETVACMFRTVVSKRFDPPEGGASVVNVPVTFVRVPPGQSEPATP